MDPIPKSQRFLERQVDLKGASVSDINDRRLREIAAVKAGMNISEGIPSWEAIECKERKNAREKDVENGR